jgi:hypothetical protein
MSGFGEIGTALGFRSAVTIGILVLTAAVAWAGTDITTHHVDSLRTGWNNAETVLTPKTVVSGGFGVLHSVALDEQVDAQPLVVRDQPIEGNGRREVVYVATEANSVYAIDAATGDILLRANFGPPVPRSSLPGKCSNNSNNVGITSTPVIDLARRTMYVVTYTLEQGAPIYRIHALDLATLRDRVVPAPEIKAMLRATPDAPIRFDAATNRQRAALLLANGNVYAAFASFCDIKPGSTRGWVLGWSLDTLRPLPSPPLVDGKAAGATSLYLPTVWMSGAGPAADAAGRIYVVTGNAHPDALPVGEREMSESLVALSGDLRFVSEYFTPQNRDWLDLMDYDFGSGGVLLLPDQPGPVPHLATAGGKDGVLYLVNRDHLGGYAPGGPDQVLGKYDAGRCFCVQSYFTGADGANRVVTSGDNKVMVWKVVTSPSVGLVRESVSPPVPSGQFAGFMNMVSSSGIADAIIWAVPHPRDDDPTHTVKLYAFAATDAAELTSLPAGVWPNITGNANIVPVVANGKVFVASYRTLSIFGLRAAPSQQVDSQE